MFLHQHVEDTNTTDRERILHLLVLTLRHAAMRYQKPTGVGNFDDLGCIAAYQDPQVGDLVIGASAAQIGVVVERPADKHGDGWMIRPVGLDKVERWGNESFYVIHGMRHCDLLIGKQAAFWALVRRKCDGLFVQSLTYRGKKFIDGAWSTAVMTTSCEVRTYDVAFDGDHAVVTYRVKFEDSKVRVTIDRWRQRWSVKWLRAAILAGLEGATADDQIGGA